MAATTIRTFLISKCVYFGCIAAVCGQLRATQGPPPTITEPSHDWSYYTLLKKISDFKKMYSYLDTVIINPPRENHGTNNYLYKPQPSLMIDGSNGLKDPLSLFNISVNCLNHTTRVFNALTNGELWAIKMLDAAGKPPSDVLDFRLTWYGSFDECQRITQDEGTSPKETSNSIQGQYCTVVFPTISGQPEKVFPVMKSPIMLVSGKLPGLNIGVCFPESCSENDVTNIVNLGISLASSYIPLSINQTSFFAGYSICQKRVLEYDVKAVVAILVLVVFVAILLIATIYGVYVDQKSEQKLRNTSGEQGKIANTDVEETKFAVHDETSPLLSKSLPERKKPEMSKSEKLLLSFSVLRNGSKILNTHQTSESITCIHGIRVFSIAWIVLGHTYAFGIAYGDNSTTFLPEMLFRSSYHVVLRGFLAVDSFFAMSGILLAYLVLKEMKRIGGKLNWKQFYLHRIWRLTPPYMLVMLLYVPLFPYLLDGPMWPQKGMEKDFCKDTWWTNLLYVNNFVYVDKQCMPWCWYLANDMQFYILSPLVLLPLFYYPAIGITICFFVLLMGSLATGIISSTYDMPPSMFGGGGDPASGQRYLEDYYIRPYCRVGPYILGIMTGYALYKTNCKVRLNKCANLCVWCVSLCLAITIVYGLAKPLSDPEGTLELSTSVSALYNAVHRSVWGACICWVIFACATGNGGSVNKLLSWPALVPFSRLTYCSYLIHPVVIFAYYGSLRVPYFYTDFSSTSLFLGNLIMVFMAGCVISLLFEAPMLGMEKALIQR